MLVIPYIVIEDEILSRKRLLRGWLSLSPQ
jgi:hypothetical protein